MFMQNCLQLVDGNISELLRYIEKQLYSEIHAFLIFIFAGEYNK
jgi:hypothetical protein